MARERNNWVKYDKFSCKGVNKQTNVINLEKYLNVLLTKQSNAGLNEGFRVVNNSMFTYTQEQNGFAYFYPKQKVLQHGGSTLPLDIYVLFENSLLQFLFIIFHCAYFED